MNRDPSENGRHNVVKVGEMDDQAGEANGWQENEFTISTTCASLP